MDGLLLYEDLPFEDPQFEPTPAGDNIPPLFNDPAAECVIQDVDDYEEYCHTHQQWAHLCHLLPNKEISDARTN